jgi:hypothetical protein
MSKRKPPAAETGIKPELAELAAKIDEVSAHARRLEATEPADNLAADNARRIAYEDISKLKRKVARVAATRTSKNCS